MDINNKILLNTFIFVLGLSYICFFSEVTAQDYKSKITAPFYNLEENFKIINDSITLNGYLIFEFDPSIKEVGYRDFKKFFTFNTYFVFNIDDLSLANCLKFYYNSNKFIYSGYTTSGNLIDSHQINEKMEFIKTYKKYQKGKRKIFKIENYNLSFLLDNNNINFLKIDSIPQKGFFIFKFSVNACLFTTQVDNIFSKTDSNSEKLNLMFFEPISEAQIFTPLDKETITLYNLQESNLLKKYLNE